MGVIKVLNIPALDCFLFEIDLVLFLKKANKYLLSRIMLKASFWRLIDKPLRFKISTSSPYNFVYNEGSDLLLADSINHLMPKHKRILGEANQGIICFLPDL